MKKVLFCLQTMTMGGVETTLINLLNKFNPNEYEITVLLLYIQDQTMVEKLPNYVKFINLNIDKKYYCSGIIPFFIEGIKKYHINNTLKTCCKRLFLKEHITKNINISDLSNINEKYDYAVCYHMHSSLVIRYVIEKINADKKYIWINNDFKNTGFPVNQYIDWLNEYHKIISTSKKVSDEFNEFCPSLKEKNILLYNILNEEEIFKKSLDVSEIDKDYLNNKKLKILTIGRFVSQKGYDLAIQTANILKEEKIDFTWYAIGEGIEKQNIIDLIKKYNLKNNFVLLGRKENPYPYIKNCDFYIQPSRHEAYCTTTLEAKLLKKLIICTNVAGASDQFDDYNNGLIVNEFTPEAIAEKIIELINNKELQYTILENLNKNTNDNKKNWLKIKNLFK